MKRKASVLPLSIVIAAVAASTAWAQVSVTGVAGGDDNGEPPFETISAAIAYATANDETVVTLDTNDELAAWGEELEGFAWPNGLFTIVGGSGFSPVVAGHSILLDVDNADATVRLEGFEIRNLTEVNATLLNTCGNVELIGMTLDNSGARGASDEGTAGGFALASNVIYNAGVANVPGSTLLVEDTHALGVSGIATGNGHDNLILRRSHFEAVHPGLDYNYAASFASRISGGMAIDAEQCIFESDTTVVIFTSQGDPAGIFDSVSFENSVFLSGKPRNNNGGVLFATSPTNGFSFIHCTFRVEDFTADTEPGAPTLNAFGVMTIAGNLDSLPLHVANSLFDSPHTGRAGIYSHYNPPESFSTAQFSGDHNTYNMAANTSLRLRTTFPGPWETTAIISSTVIDTENPDPFLTDADGRLRGESVLVSGQAMDLTPPVEVDFEGDPRPGGGQNDVGADQIYEAPPTSVHQWQLWD